MEQLLQYCWKHKILPLHGLQTPQGEKIEVIDAGLQNTDSGPDFFNAKVKINGVVWAGNVEVHTKASLWNEHGHAKDDAYNNVILHVCQEIDMQAVTHSGIKLKQVQMNVPQYVKENYDKLLASDNYPSCKKVVKSMPKIVLYGFLDRLSAERLEQKTASINDVLKKCKGSWEHVLFVVIARNFGFGVNTDVFEEWALSVPVTATMRFRNNLTQIEALFFGQSGLLNKVLNGKERDLAIKEAYFNTLVKEYSYLQHKLNVKPINAFLWKFLRLRPHNFPYIRLSQLANLFASGNISLSKLLDSKTKKDMEQLIKTKVSPFWETHFSFSKTTLKKSKGLSKSSIELIIINTLAPILFAYGKYRNDEMLCERALNVLSNTKKESNSIINMWQQSGMEIENAAQSQALIQLKKHYCDTKKCLQCRIGYEFLKAKIQ